MAKNTREKRHIRPTIILVCEGRNKTETLYFNHFKKRDSPYNLHIKPSEDPSANKMIDKAERLINDLELSAENNDQIFCLIDLDLDEQKLQYIENYTKTHPNSLIQFVLSNPCFEVWYLYHFTPDPKRTNASQQVKKEVKKINPNYAENYDIANEKEFLDNTDIAINNSLTKNNNYPEEYSKVEKNPYTEVQELVNLLKHYDNTK